MKPRNFRRTARLAVVLATAGLAAGAAHAQTAGSTSMSSRTSWLPYTQNGYIGLNLGHPHYSLGCGAAGSCDNPDLSGNLYVGGNFNNFAGIELGYLHMGNMDRGGGTTRAQGLNVSLVGRAPVWNALSLYGKVGATYGRTKVDAPVSSGLATGKESGWGPSYGFGATYNFTPQLAGVLDWQRNKFEFAGTGREWVRATSIGVRYSF